MFDHLIDLIQSRFPEALNDLENIAVQNPAINAFVLDRLASRTAPRPHPYSLASDYTSWKSLTDRSYTGRHLPNADQSYVDSLSAIDFYIEQLNIDYTRQFKLRSYNDYRNCFGLRRAKSFSDINKDPEIHDKLAALYQTVDDVEWYVGMYAEEHPPLAMMGELQTPMVANDAFSQALTNPLLAERIFNRHTFSDKGWEIIQETESLDQILQRNGSGGEHCSLPFLDQ